jgi:membrane associated rhomboid family serine protease
MALFNSIWDDLKYSLRAGSMVTKLMVVNFAVFVGVSLAHLVVWLAVGANGGRARELFYDGLNWLCMPASAVRILMQPWSLFTSLFLHAELGHFLGNTIALYLFGTLVSDLIGNRRVLPLYLLAGLFGNMLFYGAAQLFPSIVHYNHAESFALGASGAIMGLGGAALVLAPDYRVMLFLLGEVKVKYIVLVLLLLDLVGIAHNINTGGHAAHIGGFAFGCLFVVQMRGGRDLSAPVNRLFDKIADRFDRGRNQKRRPRRKAQMAVKGPFGPVKGSPAVSEHEEMSFQEKLDLILDKIKAQGYQNLTPEEKEFLHNASKK